MRNVLILLAGYPGTGKTYLCDKIKEWRNCFVTVSPDALKEQVWDEKGFENLDEKEACIEDAWRLYYEIIDQNMRQGRCILSDYPFSDKQKPTLESLSKAYAYRIVTIRLTADLDVLFARQKKRDVDPSRHSGHILHRYHVGVPLRDRAWADGLLSYTEFIARCQTRGYGTFALGEVIELDVTDFRAVDYTRLLQRLETCAGFEG